MDFHSSQYAANTDINHVIIYDFSNTIFFESTESTVDIKLDSWIVKLRVKSHLPYSFIFLWLSEVSFIQRNMTS